MAGNIEVPDHEAVVSDLARLRAAGLTKLRHIQLPALSQAARLATDDVQLEAAPAIEQLLRLAISKLDSGEYGDAALALIGLAEGMRAWSPADRRERAASQLERSADTFRRRYEANLLADVADQILALCAEQRLRAARNQLERRHPAESRLAVQWVERFESYHRLWTPAWALGAELTAYRSTLLEPDRPYDRAPGVLAADDSGYTQELQAEGYARFALYRWAWFQWQLRQFMLQQGGMWLLSTGEAETKAADLVYAISWHVTTYNERDHSWLRNAVAQSRGQEMDHFLGLLTSTTTGDIRWREWLAWCGACQCQWEVTSGRNTAAEHFPTAVTEPGIASNCQVHAVVQACGDYCDLIEEEWQKIADWYHLEDNYQRGVNAEELYQSWRRAGDPA